VTIAICMITALALFHLLENQERQRHNRTAEHQDHEILSVLAAQFGAIFTLPSLRQILPDAPAFGKFFFITPIIFLTLSEVVDSVSFPPISHESKCLTSPSILDLVAIVPNLTLVTVCVSSSFVLARILF
jgi:hypothetical protein